MEESFCQSLTKYENLLLNGNILQAMNDFPVTPDFGTPPETPAFEGIWHFIENQRTIWMKNAKFTDAIGEDRIIIASECGALEGGKRGDKRGN